MPRRPWIGIHPSQYSTTWRNVTGPPAPPMMIGGCGVGDRLRPAPRRREVHVLAVERRLLLRPQLAHREHVLAGDRPPLRRVDAVVLHLLLVPPDADAEHDATARDSRSSVAIVLAWTIGSCWATSEMPVPRRSRSVTVAGGGRGRRTGRACGGTPRAAPGRRATACAGSSGCACARSPTATRSPVASSSAARRSGRIDRSVGKMQGADVHRPATVRRPDAGTGRTRTSRRRAAVRRVGGTSCGSRPAGVTCPPDGGRARWRVGRARPAARCAAHPWSVIETGQVAATEPGLVGRQSGGERSVCSANLMCVRTSSNDRSSVLVRQVR